MSRERFIGRMMRDAEKRLSGEKDPEPVLREPVRPRSTEDVVFQYIIDQNTKRLHDLCRQSRSFRRSGRK